MDILTTPAPKPRPRKKRITNEIRNMKPGESVVVDANTARCIVAHFRYHERTAVQRKTEDGKIQVWLYA